jgi:Ni/Fe-hydrogenase subunit HybB-like protein
MVDRLLKDASARLAQGWNKAAMVFAGLAAAGGAAFLWGVSGTEAGRAWQAYLVNYVYWMGLSCGAVLFSAILTMTHARWGRPIKRLAESFAAFLPVGVVGFGLLYLGRESLFPWMHETLPHEKQIWLNVPFFFARDGLALFSITAAAMLLVRYSVQCDREAGSVAASRRPPAGDAGGRFLRLQTIWATIYSILYGLILSLLGFDLIMSLSPHWHSTLFGAYYFMGSFYCALAMLAVIAGLAVEYSGWEKIFRKEQLRDLGKLLLGFCVVTADFFYSQFFVIWFGNIPEETRYVILRIREMPWQPLAWTVLGVSFVVPFIVLLSRRLKENPRAMVMLGLAVLAGMWLERLLLVAPSIWEEGTLPLGVLELLIAGGFVGVVALCVLFFLRSVPLLPMGDPFFWESLEGRVQEAEVPGATTHGGFSSATAERE